MRPNEIANKKTKTGKVTAVVAVMSIYCRKKRYSQSANPRNKKPSCHKAGSAKFLEENSHKLRILSHKN
jgi:hypothetical protein